MFLRLLTNHYATHQPHGHTYTYSPLSHTPLISTSLTHTPPTYSPLSFTTPHHLSPPPTPHLPTCSVAQFVVRVGSGSVEGVQRGEGPRGHALAVTCGEEEVLQHALHEGEWRVCATGVNWMYVTFQGCYVTFQGCYVTFQGCYVTFQGCYVAF